MIVVEIVVNVIAVLLFFGVVLPLMLIRDLIWILLQGPE